jgi:sulfur carrier protein
MTETLRLNGKVDVIAATTVDGLMRAHGIDPGQVRFLAVAVNGSVVPRAEWPSRALAPGDDVEIVRPLQGG